MIVNGISDLLAIDPTVGQQILFGFDVFANAYPISVWSEAFERAQHELGLVGA